MTHGSISKYGSISKISDHKTNDFLHSKYIYSYPYCISELNFITMHVPRACPYRTPQSKQQNVLLYSIPISIPQMTHIPQHQYVYLYPRILKLDMTLNHLHTQPSIQKIYHAYINIICISPFPAKNNSKPIKGCLVCHCTTTFSLSQYSHVAIHTI